MVKECGIMKKDQRATVVEFVSKMPDDELRFVVIRLVERVAGDLAEALAYFSRKPEMDNILSTASSGTDLFDMCDNIRDVVAREAKKRKLVLYPEPDEKK